MRQLALRASIHNLLKSRHLEQYNWKTRKKSGKQQWGPNVPVRRSSRNLGTGRNMVGKAMEAKRKWNLEDKAGITNKSKSSKSHLLSICQGYWFRCSRCKS
jgi:uncharacterized protein (UPF0548 family)